jgi:hypothetical protein
MMGIISLSFSENISFFTPGGTIWEGSSSIWGHKCTSAPAYNFNSILFFDRVS